MDSTQPQASDSDEERIREVVRIRIDGAQIHDVADYAADKGWGLTDQQVRDLVRLADNRLAANTERNRRRILARHIAQLEALYARAVNGADYRTALAVLSSLARVQGLNERRDGERAELIKLARAQAKRIAELEGALSQPRAIVAQSEPNEDG